MIVCVELLIISFALLVLQIIEYFQLRDQMKSKTYFKINPKRVDLINVKSVPPEDDVSDYDEDFVPFEPGKDGEVSAKFKDINSYTQIKQQQLRNPRAIRNMYYLERMLQKMEAREYAREQGLDTVKEIDALHERDIMERHMRRCKSFRMARPNW